MKRTPVLKSIVCVVFFVTFYVSHGLSQDYKISEHVAILSELTGGKISAEKFKNATGLDLKSPDESQNCEVAEFGIVWVEKGKDPVEVIVRNANFNERALKLTAKAKSGTAYYIENVKIKCEGQKELEKVNSLVFKIE